MKEKKFLKMRLLLTLIISLFFGVVGSFLLPSPTMSSCRIDDISLEKEGSFTKLTIYADKPFEFVHSTAETKDKSPYRVIIDCKDAIHDLPQHNFAKSLPSGTIKAIRTSQFQTVPEKIVRIVLDLDKPVIYKVTESGEGKKGAIALLTAQDSYFPFWTAVKNGKPSAETKLASSIPVEKTTPESLRTEDRLLDSSENKGWVDLEPAEKAEGQGAKEKVTFEKPLSFADTSETGTKKEVSQVSMSKPEAEKSEFGSSGKGAEIKEKVSKQKSEKTVLATPLISPEVFSAPDQKNKKLQSEQGEDKKGGTIIEKEASKSSFPIPSSQAPLKIEKEKSSSLRQAQGGEQGRTADSQKLSLIEDSERSQTKGTSSKHSGKEEYVQKKLPSSQQEAISSAAKAEKAAVEPAKESKTESMNLTAEQEKVTLLSAEQEPAKGGAVSPESLIVVSKPEGTELQVVFQRRVIHYHGEGRRDPFTSLTERISTDFGKLPLPMFESLKLVGILKDEEGHRALLEDEKGYGYILKGGDKIKNGYVVSVEDKKVVFQIQEYGWSKTIALELSTEY
jgi:hypothetical protein